MLTTLGKKSNKNVKIVEFVGKSQSLYLNVCSVQILYQSILIYNAEQRDLKMGLTFK